MTGWKWREAWLSEKKIHSKPERHKDYIWEVVNNCAWLECEVKASNSVLLNKDGIRRLGGEAEPDRE